LLDVLQAVLLDLADHGDGFARGLVALVGVDADVHGLAGGGAHDADDLDVADGIDADLDLDGADAFGGDLGGLALGLLDGNQADGMGDGDAVASPAAEQGVDGDAEPAAGEVVDG